MKEFSDTQKAGTNFVNQTYSLISNAGFFALSNSVYYNYFYRYVRRWAWWYDRFVPDFHSEENGVFSTGIAHALVDGIANLIVGKKILLQTDDVKDGNAKDDLVAANKWANNADFTNKVRMLARYAAGLGTALIKINSKGGELWLEPFRMDDFFYEVDFLGEVKSVTCLIKSYTDTNSRREVEWADDNGKEYRADLSSKFYLVETRYFKREKREVLENGEKIIKDVDVPYAVYAVHRYQGSITNTQAWNISNNQDVQWLSIPKNVRDAIKRDYSIVTIGEPRELPFYQSLGCVLYRYNCGDGSLSQQPFGESISTNLIADYVDYDSTFSWAFRDKYQGKGIVLVAKDLQVGKQGDGALNGLDSSMFTQLQQYADGKERLPVEQIQFGLRVEEWSRARNAVYESIAMKLSISPSSIASFLSDNSARTAKEVSTEATATDNYVDIQRGILEPCLNQLLKIVSDYYGWKNTVEVRWAKSGSQNMDTVIDRVVKLAQAGLITTEDALKQLNPDADEYEISEKAQKLKEFNEAKEANRQQSMFGDGLA